MTAAGQIRSAADRCAADRPSAFRSDSRSLCRPSELTAIDRVHQCATTPRLKPIGPGVEGAPGFDEEPPIATTHRQAASKAHLSHPCFDQFPRPHRVADALRSSVPCAVRTQRPAVVGRWSSEVTGAGGNRVELRQLGPVHQEPLLAGDRQGPSARIRTAGTACCRQPMDIMS